jgi:hypothetical protein
VRSTRYRISTLLILFFFFSLFCVCVRAEYFQFSIKTSFTACEIRRIQDLEKFLCWEFINFMKIVLTARVKVLVRVHFPIDKK